MIYLNEFINKKATIEILIVSLFFANQLTLNTSKIIVIQYEFI